MNSVAPDTGATVTVTGPGIVTGSINSGGDPEGIVCAHFSTARRESRCTACRAGGFRPGNKRDSGQAVLHSGMGNHGCGIFGFAGGFSIDDCDFALATAAPAYGWPGRASGV